MRSILLLLGLTLMSHGVMAKETPASGTSTTTTTTTVSAREPLTSLCVIGGGATGSTTIEDCLGGAEFDGVVRVDCSGKTLVSVCPENEPPGFECRIRCDGNGEGQALRIATLDGACGTVCSGNNFSLPLGGWRVKTLN